MTIRTLPQDAIDFMKGAGYRVFMHDRTYGYAYFATPDGIGYVQFDPMSGYTVCTVHKPNPQSGTGYQIARGAPVLNDRILDDAIRSVMPSWALGDERPPKYSGITEYREQGAWQSLLQEV